MVVTGCQTFYGRKAVLDILRKRVLDFKDGYRQNAALTGFRHIGKTSILQKFLAEVSAPDTVQIYIDAEFKDAAYFCSKIAGSILYEFSKIRSLPLNEQLTILIETTQEFLPRTTAAIKKAQRLLRHGKDAEAYTEMIALPQVFSSETGLFCVLVIDEFQCLEDWGIADAFSALGKTIMTQKQCLYIFGSSTPEQARTILSEKLSLLFGNFETIEIGAFDMKTCGEYVSRHLPGLQIRDDLKAFLIDFTGGHPLYLRLLCSQLVYLAGAHDQKEIFVPLLSRAVEDIVFDPWGVLSRHFDLMIQQVCAGRGNMLNAAVLTALSGGKKKVKDLAEALEVKQGGLSLRLRRLQEAGLAAKTGRSFYINDRLLRYWLFYVFRRRWEAMEIDPARRREQFRAEFARAADDFRLQYSKEMPSRIMELFSCFDDEAFHSGGRQYKLPVFETIAAEKFGPVPGADFDVIRALTLSGDVWVALLKDGDIREQDLSAAVAQIRERFARPRRCILISLTDLDETVRVRALQERMWIWNENELRTLLNIYNKPYIAAP